MKKNLIIEKSFHFSQKIIENYKKLIINKEFIMSKQFLKCGTSIGANVEEAIGGQTKKDFIAKMSIAYKEARETRYWIRLLGASNYLDRKQLRTLRNDIEELMKILCKILISAKDTLD